MKKVILDDLKRTLIFTFSLKVLASFFFVRLIICSDSFPIYGSERKIEGISSSSLSSILLGLHFWIVDFTTQDGKSLYEANRLMLDISLFNLSGVHSLFARVTSDLIQAILWLNFVSLFDKLTDHQDVFQDPRNVERNLRTCRL